MEGGITRAKQLSKQAQREYSESCRLIDEQSVTERGGGDAELTRRLSKWLNKRGRGGRGGGCGHKGRAEKLERLGASSVPCRTN